VGIQLVIYWLLMRALEELSQREEMTKKDMGTAVAAAQPGNGMSELMKQARFAGTVDRS
jgi:hypothetical protein